MNKTGEEVYEVGRREYFRKKEGKRTEKIWARNRCPASVWVGVAANFVACFTILSRLPPQCNGISAHPLSSHLPRSLNQI